MPELPEVEIIAQGLNNFLQGLVIRDLTIYYPKCIQGPVQEYKKQVQSKEVLEVHRRGKLVIMRLSTGLNLVFHLKMTGKLLFFAQDTRVDHTRVNHTCVNHQTRLLFCFQPRAYLCFQDLRKFGYTCCLTDQELQHWPFYRDLGPEPLQLHHDDFAALFKGRRARIKALLLDQKVLAGIGNIYADESLFLAGIHPATPADQLKENDFFRLLVALQRVLRKALDLGGSSFSDYVNSLGERGSFQDHFQVYGRGGRSCKHCGTSLERIRVAGRSTVFCPRCQPVR